MKKRFILAFVLTALGGCALHFAYPLLPYPLVGLFAPVSESVWEHLKLLFWPFLLAAFILTRRQTDALRVWSGFLSALFLMPAGLLGVRYVLADGFCVQSVFLDVALYVLALAGGFALSWRLWKTGRAAFASGVLVIFAGLYGSALVLFTMAPPQLPIFLPGR